MRKSAYKNLILVAAIAVWGCATKHPEIPQADGITSAGESTKAIKDTHTELRDVLNWFKQHAQESPK